MTWKLACVWVARCVCLTFMWRNVYQRTPQVQKPHKDPWQVFVEFMIWNICHLSLFFWKKPQKTIILPPFSSSVTDKVDGKKEFKQDMVAIVVISGRWVPPPGSGGPVVSPLGRGLWKAQPSRQQLDFRGKRTTKSQGHRQEALMCICVAECVPLHVWVHTL